jgi:hypothetical protein
MEAARILYLRKELVKINSKTFISLITDDNPKKLLEYKNIEKIKNKTNILLQGIDLSIEILEQMSYDDFETARRKTIFEQKIECGCFNCECYVTYCKCYLFFGCDGCQANIDICKKIFLEKW